MKFFSSLSFGYQVMLIGIGVFVVGVIFLFIENKVLNKKKSSQDIKNDYLVKNNVRTSDNPTIGSNKSNSINPQVSDDYQFNLEKQKEKRFRKLFQNREQNIVNQNSNLNVENNNKDSIMSNSIEVKKETIVNNDINKQVGESSSKNISSLVDLVDVSQNNEFSDEPKQNESTKVNNNSNNDPTIKNTDSVSDLMNMFK